MVGKSPASLPHQNLWKVQVCQLVAARFSNQPPHYPLSTGDTSLEVAAFPRVPCLFCGPNAYRFVPVPMDWTSQFALTWGQAARQLISTNSGWIYIYVRLCGWELLFLYLYQWCKPKDKPPPSSKMAWIQTIPKLEPFIWVPHSAWWFQ